MNIMQGLEQQTTRTIPVGNMTSPTEYGDESKTHTHTYKKCNLPPSKPQFDVENLPFVDQFPQETMDYPPSFCMVSPGQLVDLREIWS